MVLVDFRVFPLVGLFEFIPTSVLSPCTASTVVSCDHGRIHKRSTTDGFSFKGNIG